MLDSFELFLHLRISFFVPADGWRKAFSCCNSISRSSNCPSSVVDFLGSTVAHRLCCETLHRFCECLRFSFNCSSPLDWIGKFCLCDSGTGHCRNNRIPTNFQNQLNNLFLLVYDLHLRFKKNFGRISSIRM